MKDGISPEEKLLQLIRGQKRPPLAIEPSGGVPPSLTKSQEKGPAAALKGKGFSFHLPKFPALNLRNISWALLGASLFFLAYSLFYPFFGFKAVRLENTAVEKELQPEPAAKAKVLPAEFYLEEVRRRNIFANAQQDSSAAQAIAGEAESIKDINLVGIISGENPQAIVEDKKTQKTYYVNKGQFVGDFQVDQIGEGKIILNYKGQKYELSI